MQQLIGVYGASGFGKQVMSLVKIQYTHLDQRNIVFIDDSSDLVTLMGHQILDYNEFLAHSSDHKEVTIAIANSKVRELLANKLAKDNIKTFAIHSNNSILSDYSELAEGSILCNFVYITEDSKIGKFFHANIYSYVGHDCVIGDYVTFGPRVSCNGNIHIHDHVYIGTGAIIKQGTPDKPLIIGEGAFIGMGAVVNKDVSPGKVAVGNPARAFVLNK